MTKVLFLSHNPNRASFRYRLSPLIAELESRGVHCETIKNRDKIPGLRIVKLKNKLQEADAVYLHKLNLTPLDAWLIRRFAKCVFFDIDDAIYMKQPRHEGEPPRYSKSRRASFESLASVADVCSVGNETLAAKVSAAGGIPLIIPTGIDVNNYIPIDASKKEGCSIIWIGLPENIRYLAPIKQALVKLAKNHPRFTLKIISKQKPDWPDCPIELIQWSSETEKRELPLADIGIMPLFDDEYSRAKCAFKLIQYMAAGLPCVGSPVGSNCEAVTVGENGFLAASNDEWFEKLDTLINSEEMRTSMGLAGRRRAEERYDVTVLAHQLADTLVEKIALTAAGSKPHNT